MLSWCDLIPRLFILSWIKGNGEKTAHKIDHWKKLSKLSLLTATTIKETKLNLS